MEANQYESLQNIIKEIKTFKTREEMQFIVLREQNEKIIKLLTHIKECLEYNNIKQDWNKIT